MYDSLGHDLVDQWSRKPERPSIIIYAKALFRFVCSIIFRHSCEDSDSPVLKQCIQVSTDVGIHASYCTVILCILLVGISDPPFFHLPRISAVPWNWTSSKSTMCRSCEGLYTETAQPMRWLLPGLPVPPASIHEAVRPLSLPFGWYVSVV